MLRFEDKIYLRQLIKFRTDLFIRYIDYLNKYVVIALDEGLRLIPINTIIKEGGVHV
jgi:hypothetical protein